MTGAYPSLTDGIDEIGKALVEAAHASRLEGLAHGSSVGASLTPESTRRGSESLSRVTKRVVYQPEPDTRGTITRYRDVLEFGTHLALALQPYDGEAPDLSATVLRCQRRLHLAKHISLLPIIRPPGNGLLVSLSSLPEFSQRLRDPLLCGMLVVRAAGDSDQGREVIIINLDAGGDGYLKGVTITGGLHEVRAVQVQLNDTILFCYAAIRPSSARAAALASR